MSETRREVLVGATAAMCMPSPPLRAAARSGSSTIVIVDGLKVSVNRHPGHAPAGQCPVLYVHGATFPSGLAVDWRFEDGGSWADDLAEAGHDVWMFDFAGYGRSDRYAAMGQPATPGPLGRSDAAVRQLAAVIDLVRAQTKTEQVALLAHSWGTIVAARYAAWQPARVDRLVLFGPILLRQGKRSSAPPTLPGWEPLTLAAQISRFREDVPTGEPQLITDEMFAPWGAAYLATDPNHDRATPPTVAVPDGPVADIADARAGLLPYDPSHISCPVAILRGVWDSRCTDADVAWFKRALTKCPHFSDARLERGTHLMHLETGRSRLWAAARNALDDVKRAVLDTHAVLFEVELAKGARDAYLAAAASLRPLLDEVDGFVSIERFASEQRPDWILSLSFWADDAAIAAWRSRERHHEAQVKGRSGIFEDYRLRVARVQSDNSVTPRRQPERDSTYNDPSRRRVRRVAVVEVDDQTRPALIESLCTGLDVSASESFLSLTTPGKRAYVIEFADTRSMSAWQKRMAPVSFSQQRIRTMEVLRDYGMFDRVQAPQYHPDAPKIGA